jgi:hypothetical protein
MNTPMTSDASRTFEQIRDELIALLKKGDDIPAELQNEATDYIARKYPAFVSLAKAMLSRYHKAPQPLRAGAAAALLAYLTSAKV